MTAPIDRCKVVPVPGEVGSFVLVDKETNEVFNIPAAIEAAFAAGQCKGK